MVRSVVNEGANPDYISSSSRSHIVIENKTLRRREF